MKKFVTLCLGAACALSASALTLEDLQGKYEMKDVYAEMYYVCEYGSTVIDSSKDQNVNWVSKVRVTLGDEENQLVFSNWCGFSFVANVDLEAMTVTVPVQDVTTPTGYTFTLCLMEDSMFPEYEGDEKVADATFDVNDAKPVVMNITEDGYISLFDYDTDTWNYMALWNWGANYLYACGEFHKYATFEPDQDVLPIIGNYVCNTFKGEWSSIWGSWDPDTFSKFDIATGEGIDEIGVDEGPFDVTVTSLGGKEVSVNGLFWGGMDIVGDYDPATKVITFPIQSVWGGYTLCNSSLCEVEVPTADDVKPATATVNEDGTITMHYTLDYPIYNADGTAIVSPAAYFLDAEQVLTKKLPTAKDLEGKYEMVDVLGSLYYVCESGSTVISSKDNQNLDWVKKVYVTANEDENLLYFSNWCGLTFVGVPDFEAMTVTIPVQEVDCLTGYTFTLCLSEDSMYPKKDEDGNVIEDATFDVNDAQPIVLRITDDGDLTLKNGDTWDYFAWWGWGANYGYITGAFHKTGSFEPDADVEPILGDYYCTTFNGEWSCIWSNTWDPDTFYKFNIMTGEGIDQIGVDKGSFPVTVTALGGKEVSVNGLFWGDMDITGEYDSETKTITFPLQSVWGGYMLCNSSLCEKEITTADDVVPATATINEDGSITMHYTLEYPLYDDNNEIVNPAACFLDAEQVLTRDDAAAVENISSESVDGPVQFFNLQGMRINQPANGLYIMRQGNKAQKVIR